ncbi:MAG: CPBP family intramembrane metalloprotease [Acidobacteriota bacterium]|nr:MAG: CPBP family intramembrane metalloprotease [Acidobacteriota bacterium]
MMLEPTRESHGDEAWPPWGVWGTLLGIFTAANLWLLTTMLLAMTLDQGDVFEAPLLIRYLVVFLFQAVLIVVAIAAAVLSGGGPAALGLRRYATRAIVEAVLIGVALVGLNYLYGLLLAQLSPDGYAQMALEQEAQLRLLAAPWPLLLVAAVVLAPLGEELFFRGFVYGGLRTRLGFGVASGLSAALFAVVHFMPWSVPPLFFVGLATAAAYERHRSLAACLMVHASFNLVSLTLEWIAAA